MLPDVWRRTRPLVASFAVSAIVLAGCSGSSATPVDHRSSSGSPTAAPAAATPDAAAARALQQALAASRQVRAFEFKASTRVGSAAGSSSLLTGRVVDGRGLAYTLVAGGEHSQVVRLERATFVRKVPGRWHRLRHPRSIADPGRTLRAVLHGLTPLRLSVDGGRRQVTGLLPAAAARAAGLPDDADGAQVVLRLDRRSRVVELDVHSRTTAGGTAVTIAISTSYRFGQVRPIRSPV